MWAMGENRLDPCILVIFGATGDLARRKLFPALYNLYLEGRLPERFGVVGIGRRLASEAAFRDEVCRAVKEFSRKVKIGVCGDFLESFYYQQFDLGEAAGFLRLKEFLANMDRIRETRGNRIFYLAVAPEHFGPIVDQLAASRMVAEGGGWLRIAIEKPFGHDLASARELNQRLARVFAEEEIYRIDHYLGKEMIQNLMVIRFANSLFEPLWNNRHIDNIQISINESQGVGTRGRYYEQAGALRDMFPNHLMQLVALVAMEPPVDLRTKSIRDEKVKVIRALQGLTQDAVARDVVRGQYTGGNVDGEAVRGYREEEGVSASSRTETFVAMRLFINNFRWAGVPFYLRTGKRMPERSAAVVIQFRALPGTLYFKEFGALEPNLLVLKIQPEEGVFLQFNAKELGPGGRIVPVKMNYCQNCDYPEDSPEAYERLFFDLIRGDQSIFPRWDEIEQTWAFVQPVLDAWTAAREATGEGEVALPIYPAGTWGPREACDLLEREGRNWWLVL